MFSTFLCLTLAASLASAQTAEVRTGTAALAGWTVDAPGVRRHIKPSDLLSGVAVTRDGALLVSDDANGTIFRVSHK